MKKINKNVAALTLTILFLCTTGVLLCINTDQSELNENFKGKTPEPQEATEIEILWTEDGEAICTDTGYQSDWQLVSDGHGGAIVTWEDFRGGVDTDVYAQRINLTGGVEWTSNGVVISSASGHQRVPQIISDGQGGAIIAWKDQRAGASEDDIYAQRVNSTGGVEWTVNGTVICNATNVQANVQLVSDGQGGAIIVWDDKRSGSTYDTYAQRVNSTGGVEWTANGTVICNATDYQFSPQLVSDGQGGAIIMWGDERSGTNYDIYAQRVNSTGGMEWTANGTVICNATNDQGQPQIISDGQGGAIIAWNDQRAGVSEDDIYAQRINSTGGVEWTVNGTVICNATDDQHFPQLVGDGQGGAIITWVDYRTSGSTSSDIYAQWVNSTGSVEWTVNGTAICTATNYQNEPQLVSDGQGGAIIIWLDYRDGGYDIYSQRVNSNGGALWTANGATICTAATNQETIQIISDGKGGVIVVWGDTRFGNLDIFAQRAIPPGQTPTCTTVANIDARVGATAYINWTLTDDFGGGNYRVLVNEQAGSWSDWTNNEVIQYTVDTSVVGIFNYTIQYNDSARQFGIQETVLVNIFDMSSMFIEMLNETYTKNVFNFTFQLLDANRNGITGATIRYWWNGVEWTGNMTELTNGLYRLNVSSITVAPDEAPIKLNLTISKIGYTSLYHGKNVAVDPDNLVKESDTDDDDDDKKDEDPLPILDTTAVFLIIGLTSVVGLFCILIWQKQKSKRK